MKYLLLIIIFGAVACDRPDHQIGDIPGYAPVYATAQVATSISTEPSRPTVNAGKIYAYGNYLFQVEQNEGIHIINNANPQQPQKLSFLKIPTCTEIAIRSNHLYTNNLDDLVVFNIANIAAPQLVNRVENAFPQLSQEYPPASNTYFECADPAKGIVIGWVQKTISNPKCRR